MYYIHTLNKNSIFRVYIIYTLYIYIYIYLYIGACFIYICLYVFIHRSSIKNIYFVYNQ